MSTLKTFHIARAGRHYEIAAENAISALHTHMDEKGFINKGDPGITNQYNIYTVTLETEFRAKASVYGGEAVATLQDDDEIILPIRNPNPPERRLEVA